MKYLLILFAVLILVRIDLVIHGIESLAKKVEKNQHPIIINPIIAESEIIPISEDRALKRTPRSVFFSLLVDFQTYPDQQVREQIIEVLRKNPKILGPDLDTVFEGEIYKLTDLIYNKNSELPLFLLDMMELLQGENLELVRRFSTIMLDNDLESFLSAYSRSKDTNCMIAKLHGFKVPKLEQFNGYYERDKMLTDFLKRDKIDPTIKALAKNCQLVVKLEIDKLTLDTENSSESEQP
jgi:hypothetical protein